MTDIPESLEHGKRRRISARGYSRVSTPPLTERPQPAFVGLRTFRRGFVSHASPLLRKLQEQRSDSLYSFWQRQEGLSDGQLWASFWLEEAGRTSVFVHESDRHWPLWMLVRPSWATPTNSEQPSSVIATCVSLEELQVVQPGARGRQLGQSDLRICAVRGVDEWPGGCLHWDIRVTNNCTCWWNAWLQECTCDIDQS